VEIFNDSFEVDGSVWFVDASAIAKETAIDAPQRRRKWLEQQREAWIRTTDQRQAAIQQVENSLKWAEGQRVAWQKSAEKCEERLSSWRLVAEQREQTLIELERVNGLLESAKQRLTDECHRLEGLERQASTALAEAREELAHPFIFRLKKRIKAMFPRETARGRLVRRVARIAR
jgi:chromosome segregation ATPase